MAKIITVTPNTALDNIIEVERIYPSKAIRSESSCVFPAGKGVNASRALLTLGVCSVCTGFVSADFSDFFSFADQDCISSDFITVTGPARSNITIFEHTSHQTTHITSSGFKVDEYMIAKLCEKISELAESGDIVLIAGSTPNGAPFDAYKKMSDAVLGAGARLVLDASREYIGGCAGVVPFLLKPNLEELEWICNASFDPEDHIAIVCACRELLCSGTRNVAVSLGAQGVIFVSADFPHEYFYVVVPEQNLEFNHATVGAGDCLAAGLMAGFLRGAQPEDFLTDAVALATSNMFAPGPGVCPRNDFERLRAKVQIDLIRH